MYVTRQEPLDQEDLSDDTAQYELPHSGGRFTWSCPQETFWLPTENRHKV